MIGLYEYIIEEITIGKNLIKVPESLYRALINAVYSQYLAYIAKTDEALALELSKQFKVNIAQNFKPKNKTIRINASVEDLPKKMQDNWQLTFGSIRLIIDWEQKIWADRPKVYASYKELNYHGLQGYFTINPRRLIDLLSGEYTKKDVIEIFRMMSSTIYHEATHAVQRSCLKWLDKNQIGKSRIVRDNPNSSEEERRREYLTSEIEFDPTIKSKIGQFQRKYEGQDLLKSLAIFVGGIAVEGEEPDEFFAALKATDIKKWKKAVKKFYLNYDLKIEKVLLEIDD